MIRKGDPFTIADGGSFATTPEKGKNEGAQTKLDQYNTAFEKFQRSKGKVDGLIVTPPLAVCM
jgi:hypothetical protein